MARLICGEKGSTLFCDSGETIVKENREEKKQTNADRIRAMSDEELADFIMDVSMGLLFEQRIMNVKSWLQSEVEE